MKNSKKSRIRKKSKSENDYIFLNIFVTIIYKKNPLFNEKSFSNKFICKSFNAHQKSNNIRSINIYENKFFN